MFVDLLSNEMAGLHNWKVLKVKTRDVSENQPRLLAVPPEAPLTEGLLPRTVGHPCPEGETMYFVGYILVPSIRAEVSFISLPVLADSYCKPKGKSVGVFCNLGFSLV